ncbi:hypothetical protein HMPREF0496_0305 [Lentilactobacillus hilgardii ATCC 27305]|nr:hypothetical protein HMPREF0496_0305 [Lentilactobacillus hilgardii ATCC 27305]
MHKMADSYFVVVSQKQRKTGASVPVFLYHQYKKITTTALKRRGCYLVVYVI